MSQTALTFFAEIEDALTVFVRQTAWLNTIPEKQKQPRRVTRGEQLPPLTTSAHLIEILFEIGPVQYAGMGSAIAIGEADLYAWQCNQGLILNPWENRVIRKLSREYAAMLAQASDANCPPPYVSPAFIDAERRRKIAEAMSGWADKLNQQRKR